VRGDFPVFSCVFEEKYIKTQTCKRDGALLCWATPLGNKFFGYQCLHAAPASVPVLSITLFCFIFIWTA
jgi:hypothetical protein